MPFLSWLFKTQCLKKQRFRNTLVYWPYLLIPRGNAWSPWEHCECWSLGSRREPSKAGTFLWSLSMSQVFPVASARLLKSFLFRLKISVFPLVRHTLPYPCQSYAIAPGHTLPYFLLSYAIAAGYTLSYSLLSYAIAPGIPSTALRGHILLHRSLRSSKQASLTCSEGSMMGERGNGGVMFFLPSNKNLVLCEASTPNF